jgi:uncharacterized protein (DUF488 family)
METQYDDSLRGEVPSALTLYTVGHGARSAAEFVGLLRAAAIGCIADVRSYPVSRRHPQFSQKTLAPFLDEHAIGYRWLGKALGGLRHGATTSIHTALANPSSRAYAEHMYSTAFQEGIAELLAFARVTPTAMLCAERLPQHCHRAMISDYLTAKGIAVIHIVDGGQRMPHCLNGAARWAQGRLIYDCGSTQQLEWEL